MFFVKALLFLIFLIVLNYEKTSKEFMPYFFVSFNDVAIMQTKKQPATF